MLCNARLRKKPGRCTNRVAPGQKRCRHHWRDRKPWPKGKPRGPIWLAAINGGRRRYILRRHALGLKHEGGRPKKLSRSELEQLMTKAITIANETQEIISDVAGKVPTRLGQQLMDGMDAGLAVGKDLCERYLNEPGFKDDIKFARLASDTAGWMCRLGVRVASEEFRAKREDDALALLLLELRRESQEAPK